MKLYRMDGYQRFSVIYRCDMCMRNGSVLLDGPEVLMDQERRLTVHPETKLNCTKCGSKITDVKSVEDAAY